jgi:hypothetical protein
MLAEQHFDKAAFYARLAEAQNAPWEQRVLFAKKANWFRILARLATDREAREQAVQLSAKKPCFVGYEGTSPHPLKALLLLLAVLLLSLVLWQTAVWA